MIVSDLKYGPYSPSRLDTGLCPFAFHKNYVNKETKKEGGSLPQDRGNVVHEVFEKMTAKMKVTGGAVFSKQEVIGWIAESMGKYPASMQETEDILGMASLYASNPPKHILPDTDIERKMAIKLTHWVNEVPQFEECHYDDPTAFARGKADLLTISDDAETAIFYDHKTQPNIETADTFQLGFYAWVLSKCYSLKEVHTILHFARYGRYSAPVVWKSKPTVEELENGVMNLDNIEDQVMTRVMALERRDAQDLNQWQTVSHHKCIYCRFISKCSVWRDVVETHPETGQILYVKDAASLKVMDSQSAVAVASLLNVLEKVVETCKDNLKDHVKLTGYPVAIPGKMYNFILNDSSIDWTKVNAVKIRKKTFEIFDKYKVPYVNFMGFSETFSKSIWMTENEALVKKLSDLFPRKYATTFKGIKV